MKKITILIFLLISSVLLSFAYGSDPMRSDANQANVSVKYTDTDLILDWPEISGADNYTLMAGLESDDYFYEHFLGTTKQFTVPLSVLSNNTYFGSIIAANEENQVRIGTEFNVRNPDALASIATLRAFSDDSIARLDWNKVANAGSYKLFWGRQAGDYDKTFVLNNVNTIQATVASLPKGDHYFAIAAMVKGIQGKLSNETTLGFYTVGGSAENLIDLSDGALLSIPGAVLTEAAEVSFYPVAPLDYVAAKHSAYSYSSSKEIGQTHFVLPVNFEHDGADDLMVVHMQGESGAADSIDFNYDSFDQTVSFTLNNNWSFTNIPEPARTVSTVHRTKRAATASNNAANKLVILGKDNHIVVPRNSSKIIEMPFLEQPGDTCWATAGSMMQKGLYSASEGSLRHRQVYQFMKALQIDIDEGLKFIKYPYYAEYIGVGSSYSPYYSDIFEESSYGRYLFKDDVKNKIIEEIDKGHPLIFTRDQHIVLVVGYRFDKDNNLILIQHNPQQSNLMYEEQLFSESIYGDEGRDLSDNWANLTRYLGLVWTNKEPDANRSLQSIGLFSYKNTGHAENYFLFFNGKVTDTHSAVRYHFEFNETIGNGYQWTKEKGEIEDHVFEGNVNALNFLLPVYNADRNKSAIVDVRIEVYQKNNKENRVAFYEQLNISPVNHVNVNGSLDFSSLKNSLQGVSEFKLDISLADSKTNERSTLITLGDFYLKPEKPDAAGQCPRIYDASVDDTPDTNVYILLKYQDRDGDGWFEDRMECRYFDSGKLLHEKTYVNDMAHGLLTVFFESGQHEKETHFLEDQIQGIVKQYYESGVLKSEKPYVDGVRQGVSIEYYDSEEIKIEKETPYVNGLRQGIGIWNYGSGIWVTSYFNNMADGEVKHYNSEGELTVCYIAEKGARVGDCMP